MTYEELVAYAKKVLDGNKIDRRELYPFMLEFLKQLGEDVTAWSGATIPGSDPDVGALSAGWHDEVTITKTRKMHISPTAARTYNRREAQDLAAHIAAVANTLE